MATTQRPDKIQTADTKAENGAAVLIQYRSYLEEQQIWEESEAWWNSLFNLNYNGPVIDDNAEWAMAVDLFWQEQSVGSVLPDCFRQFLRAGQWPAFLWEDPDLARIYDPFLHANVGMFWRVLDSYTARFGMVLYHGHNCSCIKKSIPPYEVELTLEFDDLLKFGVEVLEQHSRIKVKIAPSLNLLLN